MLTKTTTIHAARRRVLARSHGATATPPSWLLRANVWRGVTSPVRGKATKPQRTFDCKVKDCSDDDSAPAFGLESTAPIGTRPLQWAHQTNASETTATIASAIYANL